MFIFIDIYSFIPVSGRVGMGPSALLCPVAYDAVKTALTVMNIDLRGPRATAKRAHALERHCLQ
jgi:hypothetical protein